MTWGVAVGPVAHRRTGLLLRVGLAMLPLGGRYRGVGMAVEVFQWPGWCGDTVRSCCSWWGGVM